MNRTLILLGALLLLQGAGGPLTAQDPPVLSDPDQRYYEFWPGAWYAVRDGVVDSIPTFIVHRGVHPASFREEWSLIVDGTPSRSWGLRAWDPETDRWMFVWVSDLGHFQVWEGHEVGEHWYIQRAFEQDGRRFLSRQAWIPESPDRVLRVMERSFDEGRTWEVRSRTHLQRGAVPTGRVD